MTGRASRFRRLGFRASDSGGSAVEFALLAPVFLLILAAAVDIGGMVMVRFSLNETVSAGANYALVNAERVNAGDGGRLAGDLTTLITGGDGDVLARAVVNNGPERQAGNGSDEAGGVSGNADNCYCPSSAGDGGLDWGGAASCGSPCPDGSRAGKFVLLEARRTYRPLLIDFGMADGGAITVRAVVQTQ